MSLRARISCSARDAAFFHDLPWRSTSKPIRATVGYGVSYVGQRPLPYGELSDVIFVSDASAGLGVEHLERAPRGAEPLRLPVQARRVQLRVGLPLRSPEPTLAPERSFTAGAPRTIMLSLSATLGGAS